MDTAEIQMRNALGEKEIMRVENKIPGQCREATAIKMLRAERDRYKKALEFYAQNFVDNGVRAKDALNPPSPEPCQIP